MPRASPNAGTGTITRPLREGAEAQKREVNVDLIRPEWAGASYRVCLNQLKTWRGPAWERGSIGHPIPRGPTGAKREVTKHGNDETHGSGF